MARTGWCGKGFFCLGSTSRKNKKRIVPATRIHDGAAQSTHAWGPNGSPTSDAQNQFLFPSLLAPPSSPASYQNSMVPSSVQSPLNPPPCLNPQGSSRIPLETNSNMFAVGPYAHETALVSPPFLSTFTTAPSTAPFTPPPELAAHLTTPSSPDVPFAKLLASSLRDQHELARQPEEPYSTSSFPSPDYYRTQQDNLQAAYQFYPGSPLAHLISPAGGTGASTPFAAGGTTGTSTPCPEAENPTPLKVLPAVISTLPNLEHHLAESLQQCGLLESHMRVDDHRTGKGQENEESSEEKLDSYGNKRYTGSSYVLLNDSLDAGEDHPQSTANGFSKYLMFRGRATGSNLEEDMPDEDLLELPLLKGAEVVYQENHDMRTLNQFSCDDSEVSKKWSRSEENLLDYALSLLDGNDADMGQGANGWGPVDTSLSRESELSIQSSNGSDNQPEDDALTSLNVNPLVSGGGEPEARTYEHQKGSIVEENIGSQVAADLQAVNPGCCSRCNELASQCEQLSVALRRAQEKHAERDREADDRDQQIKQLIQLLRSKGQQGFDFDNYLAKG
ncbi:unnamed protein product [Sphagnum troendelagicum]|uniref:Uncharacterized protein n=1 Tax=Sphagnum troendelagicum TaxID=128251 RepID=A0ABP0U9X9_9BRYO